VHDRDRAGRVADEPGGAGGGATLNQDAYGIRLLVTTGDYALTQRWAEGAPDPAWPGDPEPRPVRPLVERLGLEVVEPPALADVTVVAP
jgi:hypothetical protein